MELTCPKCQGVMRSYERNGVTIDQCTECRGIFLDRGELDRLIDAENRWHAEPAQQAAAAPPPPAASPTAPGAGGLSSIVGEVARQVSQAQRGHGSYGPSYGHGYPKKRKKSFLDELFS
jgi:Zn-finger nucleic acid-binding protein